MTAGGVRCRSASSSSQSARSPPRNLGSPRETSHEKRACVPSRLASVVVVPSLSLVVVPSLSLVVVPSLSLVVVPALSLVVVDRVVAARWVLHRGLRARFLDAAGAGLGRQWT